MRTNKIPYWEKYMLTLREAAEYFHMGKSGMNSKTLQSIMDYSDISVTLDTYTHLKFEDAKVEFDRVVEAKSVRLPRHECMDLRKLLELQRFLELLSSNLHHPYTTHFVTIPEP